MNANRNSAKAALLGACLILGGFTSVAAQPPAEPQGQQDQPAGEGRQFDRGRYFERLDTNKDGALQPDEFNGGEEAFKRVDANSDGKLSQEELSDARRNRRGGEGPGGDRGGPGRFRERMLEGLKERMGATDEEWTALSPQVEKVMDLRRQASAGPLGFFGGGRRGGGGPGGGGPGGPEDEGAFPEAAALRTALEDEKTAPDELKSKLEAFRSAREKKETELKSAQKELREVVTVRQEALLVMAGLLD